MSIWRAWLIGMMLGLSLGWSFAFLLDGPRWLGMIPGLVAVALSVAHLAGRR